MPYTEYKSTADDWTYNTIVGDWANIMTLISTYSTGKKTYGANKQFEVLGAGYDGGASLPFVIIRYKDT